MRETKTLTFALEESDHVCMRFDEFAQRKVQSAGASQLARNRRIREDAAALKKLTKELLFGVDCSGKVALRQRSASRADVRKSDFHMTLISQKIWYQIADDWFENRFTKG